MKLPAMNSLGMFPCVLIDVETGEQIDWNPFRTQSGDPVPVAQSVSPEGHNPAVLDGPLTGAVSSEQPIC